MKTLGVCSDRSAYAHPKPLDQTRVQRRRAHQSRSRKVKGSANGCQRVAAVERRHARMAAWRFAYAPKATAALVAHAGSIRGETLHMAGMAATDAWRAPWPMPVARRSSAFPVATSAAGKTRP